MTGGERVRRTALADRVDELLASARAPTREFFDARGRAAGALLSRDGGALRPRRPAGRGRRSPGGALGRAPRRGRVRPPGDRRQARAAGARARAPRAGRWRRRSTLIAEPDDIVDRLRRRRADARDRAALALARERGCLTIAFAAAGAEWEFEPPGRRPVRAPGAGRDALPRALGAGPRLLRPPRPARGPRGARGPRHRRLELPLSVPGRVARPTSRRCSPTSARSVLMKADGGRRAARADAEREPRGAARRGGRAARGASTPAASCSRSATAARRPTRWTWSPTCGCRPARLARAPRDRPHRGLVDPDRDRQRRRHRARSSSAR